MTSDEANQGVESTESMAVEVTKENMLHPKDKTTPPLSFCFDHCDTPLRIRPNLSPVHGIGIFTTQQISEREIIFAESQALFCTRAYADFSEELVTEALGWISATERAAFDCLYTQTTNLHDSVKNRFMANAFDLSGPRGSVCKALVLTAARLNHSPHPNAKVYWSEIKGQLVARAIRDIEEGEEVTIAYCCLKKSTTPPRDMAFPCRCEICSVLVDGDVKERGGCLCETCRTKEEPEGDNGHEGLPDDKMAAVIKTTALVEDISATQTAEEDSLTGQALTNQINFEDFSSSPGQPLVPIFGRMAYDKSDYEDFEDIFYSDDEGDVDDLANINMPPGVHSWLE